MPSCRFAEPEGAEIERHGILERTGRRQSPLLGYHRYVPKTSVEVDPDIVRQAAEILGTTTLRATIDAALREIVHARRRLELVALLAQDGSFDFEEAELSWGSDE